MKRVWIAGAILGLLFIATLLHSMFIKTFSANLVMILEAAEDNAENDDWRSAKEWTETAMKKWEQRDIYLHITLRHNETDAVYSGFREVCEFIECQEGGEYSAANARLIAELSLLSEAEQLSLKNIF